MITGRAAFTHTDGFWKSMVNKDLAMRRSEHLGKSAAESWLRHSRPMAPDCTKQVMNESAAPRTRTPSPRGTSSELRPTSRRGAAQDFNTYGRISHSQPPHGRLVLPVSQIGGLEPSRDPLVVPKRPTTPRNSTPRSQQSNSIFETLAFVKLRGQKNRSDSGKGVTPIPHFTSSYQVHFPARGLPKQF